MAQIMATATEPVLFLVDDGSTITEGHNADRIRALFDEMPAPPVGKKVLRLFTADDIASREATIADLRAELEEFRGSLATACGKLLLADQRREAAIRAARPTTEESERT
jgi:hypothetical protein